ncbi:MAG: hypothetical protein JSW11_05410 [Candidatus Heimdallarchaeota archaeon]|nr:MAG: hypothetical protein JSW11_05410 [Candidatus Heimdallarchaeota archaeon]
MFQEPSLAGQLNPILEYLNYHGHLFLRIASDDEPDNKEGVNISPTSKSL